MKHGGWVPISNGLAKYLPHDQPFSKVEAAYSLQLDIDSNNSVTIAGCARRWGWSCKKTRSFFDMMGVEIIYSGHKKAAGKGGYVVTDVGDMSKEKKGHVRAYDNRQLEDARDMSFKKKAHAGDMSPPTTIKTKTKTKKNTAKNGVFAAGKAEFYLSKRKRKLSGIKLEQFEKFWAAFDYKRGKAEAADAWLDLAPHKELVDTIVEGAKREAAARQILTKKGQTPKMAQGWLSGRRWEDETSQTGKAQDCSACDYKTLGHCDRSTPCSSFKPSTL